MSYKDGKEYFAVSGSRESVKCWGNHKFRVVFIWI